MKIKKINKKTVPELVKETEKLVSQHWESKHFQALMKHLRQKPEAF